MRRTNIYLDDDQCAALDGLAAARDTSRAAVIREFIDAGLATAAPTVAHDVAAFDASFAGASGVADVVRGDDDRARHLRAVATGDT